MNKKIIAGLDEAGRGCVIGPLVVCLVGISKEKTKQLQEMGVKDSKLLSPQARQELAEKIKDIADFIKLQKIDVKEINKITNINNLNRLEIRAFCELIDYAPPCQVIIDSPETKLQKFKQKIKNNLQNFSGEIIAKNKADRDYVIVSAASIVAKVERDKEISLLHKQFDDFGSGYPNDEATIHFLKEYYKKNNCWPNCVRIHWDTIKQLKKIGSKKQKKIL